MSHPFEAWRRRVRLWTVPLVFFALNLAAFAVYHTTFAGNVEALQDLVLAAARDREAIAAERGTSIAYLERLEGRRDTVEQLYSQTFATEAERLTDVIREAKRLAHQAGLTPRNITYPDTLLEAQGMVEKKIVFPVDGTYDQLRRFINFLELSDEFLTLERVSLNESQGTGATPVLSIQLELSTVFAISPKRPRPPPEGES